MLGALAVLPVGLLPAASANPPDGFHKVIGPNGRLWFAADEPDPMFDMIEAHRKAGRDHEAALVEQNRLERLGDIAAAYLVGEAPCHAEYNAFDELLSAAATTVPGILAQLAYLQGIADSDAWMFGDREDTGPRLIKGFAASIANVLAVTS